MNRKRVGTILVSALLILAAFTIAVTDVSAATSPPLGDAVTYTILAGSTVTSTGPTTTNLNVGVAPGTAITGFPPGTAGPPGTIHSNDASAIAAQAANLIVFGALDQPCDQTPYADGTDLTATFPAGVGPGVYCSAGSFKLTGNLNLIGSGVWIFKTVSELITFPGSSVTGGDPCNVWWRIGSSATLDTTTRFIGNILAHISITMNNGARLNGRALAYTGGVTLISNTINGAICNVATTRIFSTTFTSGTTIITTLTTIVIYGPGPIRPVGGEILPVNALQLLAPYFVAILIAATAIGLAVMYKRRTQ